MILRPLCTWQRWISAKPPKVSRTARLSALAPSTMNKRAISGCSPRSIRSASRAFTTAAFFAVEPGLLDLGPHCRGADRLDGADRGIADALDRGDAGAG